MSNELDPEGRELLSILVQVLRTADPNHPETFITYTEVLTRLRIPFSGGNAGLLLNEHGLNSVADWVYASDFPAITGLIVRGENRMPGVGFFNLYQKRELEDWQWWLNEVRRSKEFDWLPYLDQPNSGTTQPGTSPLQKSGNDKSVETVDSQGRNQNQSSVEANLFADARRIANLIGTRVSISGEQLQRTAPERTAPQDLVANIYALLQASPLVCYLCGGIMQIQPTNRLFQPSPDRIDSSVGDYGTENLRLAHLACNLGKNASSVAEFGDWLSLVRKRDSSVTPD